MNFTIPEDMKDTDERFTFSLKDSKTGIEYGFEVKREDVTLNKTVALARIVQTTLNKIILEDKNGTDWEIE